VEDPSQSTETTAETAFVGWVRDDLPARVASEGDGYRFEDGLSRDPEALYRELYDDARLVPRDVLEELRRRELISIGWNFSMVVRELLGEPPDPRLIARLDDLEALDRPASTA
jgi:hypothetical protein